MVKRPGEQSRKSNRPDAYPTDLARKDWKIMSNVKKQKREEVIERCLELAGICELIQTCLTAPQKDLALPRHEQFSRLAEQLARRFYYGELSLSDDLPNKHAGPVRFGGIYATCFAALAHDVALEHVKIIEGYWTELHDGKGQHELRYARYKFAAKHILEIRRRFKSRGPFELKGPKSIRAAFAELIAGLRQELQVKSEPEPMTEPLTQDDLARFFFCHRNQVKTLILGKYPYELIGKRYRLRVTDMPPSYIPRTKPAKTAR